MRHLCRRAHALNEYGFLLGFLAFLGISCVTLLGHSIQDLLGLAIQPSGPNSVTSYLTATLGIQPLVTSAGLNQTQPQAGSKVLPLPRTPDALLNGASPVAVNVSSVEGNDKTVLGDLRLAAYLDQIAQQATTPDSQAYYGQLAKLAYYMGANEGQIDQYGKYANPNYSNGDALNDLLSKAAEFKTLMANPPTTLNPGELAQVMPVIHEVANISGNYLDNLHPLIGSNGKVNFDFTVNSATSVALNKVPTLNATFLSPMHNISYETLMPYDQLKAQVQTTLSNNALPINIPVTTTFKNAVTVDNHQPNGN